PLAQVSLAEQQGAGPAQLLYQESVLRRLSADQSQRARRGAHPVRRIDVVLDEQGNAVQRAARAFLPAFLVQGVGQGQDVGVDLDHAAQRWALTIDGFDAVQVLLRQGRSEEHTAELQSR